MSVAQGKWKEEQILIISVGTQTTLAQLGCHELTPPVHRIPTRMFQDPEGEGWRPYYTYKRKKNGSDEEEWVEDKDSDEGAIYPLHSGRIVNMEAFLAFLDHVHTTLTSTHHLTPILLVGSPHWGRTCKETITRFIFEKTKTPALCLMHSALAIQYGLKWPSMTIIDVGYQKVDVSCIYDGSIVNESFLGVTYPQVEEMLAGGEVFTRSLYNKLKARGFTYDMAEQLKRSNIAEVLPFVNNPPDYWELPTERGGDGPGIPVPAPGTGADGAVLTTGPATTVAATTATIELAAEEEPVAGEDGVLDVAQIVTSGQTKEFLARKEKERAEKSKNKRGKDKDATEAPKAKLPNNKRTHNVFHYEEFIVEDAQPAPPTPTVAVPPAEKSADGDVLMEPKTEEAQTGETKSEETKTTGEIPVTTASPVAAPDLAELPMAHDLPEGPITRRVRRDIEVGLERLTFIPHSEIERITQTIHRAIQGIPDPHMRTACWDNLVIVGNGSRVKGLKENIFATLSARYLISPTSLGAFGAAAGSETASGAGTPGPGTPGGTGTPAPQGVNPLLAAATSGAAAGHGHHGHGQTPTSIKMAGLPGYLGEWTKHGYEEAVFLGAQVAGRMAFCLHNVDAASLEMLKSMSLSRIDYNELGPRAIRRFSVYR